MLDLVPFVTPEHAELSVDVWAGDTQLAHRVFREGDLEGRFVLRVPPWFETSRGRTVLDFHFDEPARPVDLGVSSDARRLGLYLRSLTLGEVAYSARERRRLRRSDRRRRLRRRVGLLPDDGGLVMRVLLRPCARVGRDLGCGSSLVLSIGASVRRLR